ncbi:unnamed protein product [Adineta steineri]|uniref:Uncharacterized protein n=1 Tax=Adineta steineri TaxID=433720 RepID=A0A813ZHZ1_9BILA|nr:unnamed protein product [Adineta steineri]
MNTFITILCITITALFSVARSADPPNWLGTFIVDDSCDQAECCCLSEQVSISKHRDVELLIRANVAGVPCREQLNGSTTVAVILPIPQDKGGYQITANFLGTDNRFTLNADSQYIANVNLQYPKCSGSAQRTITNWVGTYNVDDSCNQDECCCLSEQVKISKLSEAELLVSANIVGKTCPSELNGSIEVPIPTPQDKSGFQTTTSFLGTMNRFTLSYDNQNIANVNLQFPKCSGMARRA